MGHLFKPGTKRGSFVQTRDSSMGLLFIPGTQAWVFCSDQGLNVGPLFRPGTLAWVHVERCLQNVHFEFGSIV